jgi:dipeptidase
MLENQNMNEPQNPQLNIGAVRRSAFIITIDDEYCKWEFGFNPENADELSIEDIFKVLENHFKTKMVDAKCLDVF